MRKSILTLLFNIPLLLLAQSFKIIGKIKASNPKVSKVILYYAKDGQNILDSAEVRRGSYTFEGTVSQPTRVELLAKYDNERIVPSMSRDLKTVFIEPATIEINHVDSFSNAIVKGSLANNAFEQLQTMALPYLKKANQYTTEIEALSKTDRAEDRKAIQRKLAALNIDIKENVYRKFFLSDPSSPIALFALQQYAGAEIENTSTLKNLYEKLPDVVKQSSEGKRLEQLILFSSRSEIGNTAPDFVQNDANGRPVRLSDFKGNYVLLHFWASWCIACRAETPLLKAVHEKYPYVNIISVSLNKSNEKQQWLNAIQKDSMNWTQVSDLQFWNNKIAVSYGVSRMPQNILIDKNGKIIARNIRGYELEEKIGALTKQ